MLHWRNWQTREVESLNVVGSNPTWSTTINMLHICLQQCIITYMKIQNKHTFTPDGSKRLNLTLDPFAFILNSIAMGDVLAAAPVIKHAIDNYYTTPDSYLVVAKKVFRPFFPFVPDSNFKDFDSTDEVFWGITDGFAASTLNAKSDGKFVRNTPKAMHLSHYSSLRFCDRIIPLEELNYVPLDPVDVSGFGVDFSKSVIMIATYRDQTRMMLADEQLKVARWVKSKGLTPVFVGKTDMDQHLADTKKHLIPKSALPGDVSEYGVDLRNKTNIPQLASIMAQSVAVVGVDSGPIHLAGTTKTPIICGYTSVDAALRIPTRKEGKTYPIVPNIECISCESRWRTSYWNFENCYMGHLDCVKHLTADKYIEVLNNII